MQYIETSAYALTIHKIQGASLDSALISISGRHMEAGQAYVALSRLRTLGGLYIIDYNEQHFKVCCFLNKKLFKKLFKNLKWFYE